MLTMTEIDANRKRYMELITELSENLDLGPEGLDNLKSFLDASDFFFAPASTQYAYSYDGGLCEHSLNVYDIITAQHDMMVTTFNKESFPKVSLMIVALFHDLYKIGYYEKYIKNSKIYAEVEPEDKKGYKSDELGYFKWISEECFKVKDISERDTLGSNGLNSYYTISKYINLSKEEMTAIINHTSGMDSFTNDPSVINAVTKYPLAGLLHTADYLSTFFVPNVSTIEIPESEEDAEEEAEEETENE